MDLFVSISETPELGHLEMLYEALRESEVAVQGTLNIVRGARVPIVKYIDSQGSGISLMFLLM